MKLKIYSIITNYNNFSTGQSSQINHYGKYYNLGLLLLYKLLEINIFQVMYTDEDKVFDIKYVRNATHLSYNNDISPNMDETFVDGSFKFHLGRIHCTFLYKLVVQLQVSNFIRIKVVKYKHRTKFQIS